MADINQIITLGIGTPSDIEHFILFGLNTSVGGEVELSLYEREFATGNLYERSFANATLPERP